MNSETKDIYNDLLDRYRKSCKYEERTAESSNEAIFLQNDLDGIFKISFSTGYVYIIHTTFYSRPIKWALHNGDEYVKWLDDYSEAYL